MPVKLVPSSSYPAPKSPSSSYLRARRLLRLAGLEVGILRPGTVQLVPRPAHLRVTAGVRVRVELVPRPAHLALLGRVL